MTTCNWRWPLPCHPACPSSVSVEISADGVNMLPLSTPVITSGLTYIKIQLVKAEVASAVCLRLHRPRDASTLGLSQIKLLGLTAFGNTSSATVNNPFLPSEDQVSKTRWENSALLLAPRPEIHSEKHLAAPQQSFQFACISRPPGGSASIPLRCEITEAAFVKYTPDLVLMPHTCELFM